MTLAKLQRVLSRLTVEDGNLPSGTLHTSPGSEIQITFNGQLHQEQHEYLLRVGFITNEPGAYIYRPRIKA